MTLYPEYLLKAVEDGYFLIPEDGVRLRNFEFDNVQGRITDFDHKDINMVRCLPGSERIEKKTIDRVLDIFREAGVACCWLVSPLSPPNLVDALKAKGFRNHLTDLAMITTDYDRIIRDVDGVTVKRVGREHKATFSRIIAESFGDPLDMCEYLFEGNWKQAEELDLRSYLAWRDGIDEPVGAAALLRLPGSKLYQLDVAGVLEEHRKRGVYVALVSQRVRDARDSGAKGVIIQALEKTSAPVCRKIGFEEMCRHEFYIWHPDGSHQAE